MSSSIETVAELLDAARRQGLSLHTEHADFDRSGLDFLVVHARDGEGAPWIVRTPRREAVRASMKVEARVLSLVRSFLPVAIPDWRVCNDEVVAYRRLEGTPAVTVDPERGPTWNVLDPAAPSDAFVDSFARALAALQSVPLERARAAAVPVRTIDEARNDLARAMDVSRAALAPSDALWARWHRWLDDDSVWPRHVALVHGDLHPGHMLLDDGGQLVGILDWTEAAVTDPSVDLAIFHGCFGAAVFERLVSAFERAGGVSWPALSRHAAERWAAFPALGAEWALRNDSEFALEYARGMLAAL